MIVDLFAGPGGWDEGALTVGLTDVIGVELDADACSTARAAGHRRIRADVTAYPPDRLAGVEGIIASPPCPAFSSAGKKMGRRDVPAIRAHMHATARAGWTAPELTWSDPTSALTLEPLRWVLATRPAWVALEQVPDALILWQTYALVLEGLGYQTWCGIVDAADYGVPQNRRRAIFTAHRDRRTRRPPTTHRDRHVAMTDAVDLGRFGARVELNTGRDWKKGGTRDDAQKIPTSSPAPTVAGVQTQWRWVWNDGACHANVALEEALVLQGFRADYPVAGRRAADRWKQVGNAVPPPLAAAILVELAR